MSIFLLNSAAHSSPLVDHHFRLFFQLLNLPLVHCGRWACVPKDFPHSVVKQLFPEACYPHTHTSLKIAARPSLYSLCFQRHSVLSSAFHLPVVQLSLAYKLFAKAAIVSNGKTCIPTSPIDANRGNDQLHQHWLFPKVLTLPE